MCLYCCVIDILRLTIKLSDIELELRIAVLRRRHTVVTSRRPISPRKKAPPTATTPPRPRTSSSQARNDISDWACRSVSSSLTVVHRCNAPPSSLVRSCKAAFPVSPRESRPCSLGNGTRDCRREDNPGSVWAGSQRCRFVSPARNCIVFVYQARTNSRALSEITQCFENGEDSYFFLVRKYSMENLNRRNTREKKMMIYIEGYKGFEESIGSEDLTFKSVSESLIRH